MNQTAMLFAGASAAQGTRVSQGAPRDAGLHAVGSSEKRAGFNALLRQIVRARKEERGAGTPPKRTRGTPSAEAISGRDGTPVPDGALAASDAQVPDQGSQAPPGIPADAPRADPSPGSTQGTPLPQGAPGAAPSAARAGPPDAEGAVPAVPEAPAATEATGRAEPGTGLSVHPDGAEGPAKTPAPPVPDAALAAGNSPRAGPGTALVPGPGNIEQPQQGGERVEGVPPQAGGSQAADAAAGLQPGVAASAGQDGAATPDGGDGRDGPEMERPVPDQAGPAAEASGRTEAPEKRFAPLLSEPPQPRAEDGPTGSSVESLLGRSGAPAGGVGLLDGNVTPEAAASAAQAPEAGAEEAAPSVPGRFDETFLDRYGVRSGEVVERLVQGARLHAARGVHRFEMRLEPPQLGRLLVSITVRGGEVTAVFRAENADVRDLLAASLPQLRQALAEEGVSVGRFETAGGDPSDGRGEDAPGARFAADSWLSDGRGTRGGPRRFGRGPLRARAAGTGGANASAALWDRFGAHWIDTLA